MNNDFFDDAAIEQIAKDRFGVSVEVSMVVARRIDCGQAALATFFLSAKKQLYYYIEGSSWQHADNAVHSISTTVQPWDRRRAIMAGVSRKNPSVVQALSSNALSSGVM